MTFDIRENDAQDVHLSVEEDRRDRQKQQARTLRRRQRPARGRTICRVYQTPHVTVGTIMEGSQATRALVFSPLQPLDAENLFVVGASVSLQCGTTTELRLGALAPSDSATDPSRLRCAAAPPTDFPIT